MLVSFSSFLPLIRFPDNCQYLQEKKIMTQHALNKKNSM